MRGNSLRFKALLAPLMRPRLKRLILAFFMLTLFSPAIVARVREVSVLPKDPVQGEDVKIIVKAEPNERFTIGISYEKNVPVVNGTYEYAVSGVLIPLTPNRFIIKALGVKNLHVSVKVFLIWITRSADASKGVATMSQSNMPPGKYDAIAYGEALENVSLVKLEVTAFVTVNADRDGYFEYSYNTAIIPPGTFRVTVGKLTLNVSLAEPTPLTLSQLPEDRALNVLKNIDVKKAIGLLSQMPETRAAFLFRNLPLERRVRILEESARLNVTHEIAGVLVEMAPNEAAQLILGMRELAAARIVEEAALIDFEKTKEIIRIANLVNPMKVLLILTLMSDVELANSLWLTP
ncbi:MAG: hypothetical protein DRJ41_04345 [Thermoprotei archaeon]|nr:MAG: hypothetical protein DRJ41_04345 [Thermoprotei archaeon]